MMSIEVLEKRREELLAQIEEISTMKRGTINEQYLKVSRKGKEPSLRGPYYVLSRNEGGKTVGFRVKNDEKLKLLQQDVENYKRFNDLSKEFVSVMEAITDIKRSGSIIDSKKNGKSTKKNTTVK